MWLLKNAPGIHWAGICGVYPGEGRGYAAKLTSQRMSIYVSRFDFLRALHLSIRVPFRVFEQPRNIGFFKNIVVVNFFYKSYGHRLHIRFFIKN
jgi:hypothetical protein